MRIDNEHLKREMKEIKFHNIFLNAWVHLWSWNVPSLLSCFENVGPQYFLVGAELTQNFAFLSLEFSYPSDFATIKTRVWADCRSSKQENFCFKFFFSRVIFWKRKKREKKERKNNLSPSSEDRFEIAEFSDLFYGQK